MVLRAVMSRYILRRVISVVPTLFLITLFGFLVMEAPAGDYVTSYIDRQFGHGNTAAADIEDDLRELLALDRPITERFFSWVGRFAQGDFGDSFELARPVSDIINDRIGLTLTISLATFLISWGIGIPLGVYSATHQYSRTDNFLTTVTFVGLGLPDFLLALAFLILGWQLTGEVLTGLQSPQFIEAPWSIEKLLDLLQHMWIPVLAVVVTGTAWVMRVMRGNLLDQLGRNYIVTLRAKGVPERVVIWKHAVKNALHPLVAALGQTLAWLINGFTITSIVLDLPTIQTTYLNATLQQDVFLAGTILILIGFLVLIGTLLADIFLAWLDPRIRYA